MSLDIGTMSLDVQVQAILLGHCPTPSLAPSMNVIDKQNEERQAERDFQNKFNTVFIVLKNKIRDAEISKSTDLVLEESAGSKAKKTRGKRNYFAY